MSTHVVSRISSHSTTSVSRLSPHIRDTIVVECGRIRDTIVVERKYLTGGPYPRRKPIPDFDMWDIVGTQAAVRIWNVSETRTTPTWRLSDARPILVWILVGTRTSWV